MLKRVIYSISIVLVIIFTVLAGSFWLVPTERLNSLLARQLTEAFGYNVTLSGRPSVSIYPFLNVSFGPLRVASNSDDARPLMEIERASGRLSTTSLWEGNPALRFVDLEQAKIYLIRDEAGQTNWTASRFFAEEKGGASNAPELKFPKQLKRISLLNSTVTVSDPDLEEVHKLTAVNATITGPPRGADFAIAGSFMWHGERIEGAASIKQPGAFMTGKASVASWNMSAKPASAQFNGEIIWADQLRADGVMEINIHSAPDFTGWLGLAGGDVFPDGELQVIGDGIFTPKKLDFRPIGVRFADGRADGRLVLDLSGKGLGMSGTLAFDRLVFNERRAADISSPSFVETVLKTGQSGAKMDLRISADSARVAGQEMQGVAIGVILNEPSFLVNIGSAHLSGNGNTAAPAGHLSGEIAVNFSEENKKASANLTLANVSLDTIENSLDLRLPLDGAASISFQAEAHGESAEAMEHTLDMQIVADIQAGRINSLNLGALLNGNAPDPRTFNNDNLTTPFKRAKVTGAINASGIFDISEMMLEAETYSIAASGRVDVGGNQLSMLGSVSSTDQAGQGQAIDVPFTLGGAIQRPRVSSVNGVSIPAGGNTQ